MSIFFLAIYSWTLMLFFTTTESSYVEKSDQSKKTTEYTVSSVDILSHTIQTDSPNFSLKTVTYSVFSFLPYSHVQIVHYFNSTERAELRQYINSFLNILIHHRKKDILFPFQYFW